MFLLRIELKSELEFETATEFKISLNLNMTFENICFYNEPKKKGTQVKSEIGGNGKFGFIFYFYFTINLNKIY